MIEIHIFEKVIMEQAQIEKLRFGGRIKGLAEEIKGQAQIKM